MKLALVICLGLLVLVNSVNVYGQESSTPVVDTEPTDAGSDVTVTDETTSVPDESTTSIIDESTTDVSDESTTTEIEDFPTTVNDIPSTTPEFAECVSENEMWGGDDLRKFYFCAGGDVFSDQCDEDYYYVNNATVSGCIPAEEMNPNCVNLDAGVPVCQGTNLKQPQVSQSLTKFYLCPGENEVAAELSCSEGKAFVNQDGYQGCFKWAEWRDLRDCPK